jgi:hypothetical protein
LVETGERATEASRDRVVTSSVSVPLKSRAFSGASRADWVCGWTKR